MGTWKMDKPYDNSNSGVLFINDKRVEDWQDEYTGSLNVAVKINGVEMNVDLWIGCSAVKKSQKGKEYRKLRVRPKDQQSDYVRGSQDAISAQIREELDDEIPF